MSEGGSGVHATGVVFGECGVLITGASGAGKSALGLALLARARISGFFGALIGDDRVWLETRNGRLIARGAAQTAGRIERRGVGILTVLFKSAAVVRLAAELGQDLPPRLPDGPDVLTVEGLAIPRLRLSRSNSAMDNSLIVEERILAMFPMGRQKVNFA